MKQLYLLLITLLVSLSAYAEESGTCGKHLKWKLTAEGVLTITGTGEMYNYRGSSRPWSLYSIKQVIIGDGVTTIGSDVFRECSFLTSVTIPNSVTTISSDAFSYCSSLTSVTIPSSVTTIWDSAFYGCKNIKQITSEAVTPPGCYRYAFKGINRRECKLIVPKNSIDAYKKAKGWNKFFLIEGTTTGI